MLQRTVQVCGWNSANKETDFNWAERLDCGWVICAEAPPDQGTTLRSQIGKLKSDFNCFQRRPFSHGNCLQRRWRSRQTSKHGRQSPTGNATNVQRLELLVKLRWATAVNAFSNLSYRNRHLWRRDWKNFEDRHRGWSWCTNSSQEDCWRRFNNWRL